MAFLYANENFPLEVVQASRVLGHDVVTMAEEGNAGQAVDDTKVLTLATQSDRAVLTINRRDFIKLHQRQPDHSGIIICTQDPEAAGQAERIHQAILSSGPLKGQLVRVNRPPR